MTFKPPTCRACGKGLILDHTVADGCPCNSPRGVNHGLVPASVCTCDVCDPAQTGSTRRPAFDGTYPVTPGVARVNIESVPGRG